MTHQKQLLTQPDIPVGVQTPKIHCTEYPDNTFSQHRALPYQTGIWNMIEMTRKRECVDKYTYVPRGLSRDAAGCRE